MKNIRLEAIYDLMQGDSAIDIGTDHGYLLIHLAKNNYKKLLGVEVAKGPYNNFMNNIAKQGLVNKVDGILSDGLDKVLLNEVKLYKNIVIAGMGGDLITKIMMKDINKFQNSFLILQPNNNEAKLRLFLNKHNFHIIEENIVKENKKIYEMILCRYTNKSIKKLSEEEIIFGKKTKYKKEEFLEKWKLEEEYLENISHQIKQKGKMVPESIKKQLKNIKDIRRNYETY